MPAKFKVGFFGAGKMASALARGLVRAGIVDHEHLVASDPVESARLTFQKETGGRVTTSNLEVAKSADVLIVAVKPAQTGAVLAEIREVFSTKHVLLSIAAGVPLARLEGALPEGARVIRVMPNTPALAGSSASAFALGRAASAQDAELAQQLLSSVGLAVQVPENLMDAVTGLSGSGPAYVCLFIEALSDGGVAAGLPRELATKLAAQTVMGAAKMVLETGLHPGVLKDMVTSPGGTTIEGLHQLEQGALRGAVINAVRAATEKSRKLGQ